MYSPSCTTSRSSFDDCVSFTLSPGPLSTPGEKENVAVNPPGDNTEYREVIRGTIPFSPEDIEDSPTRLRPDTPTQTPMKVKRVWDFSVIERRTSESSINFAETYGELLLYMDEFSDEQLFDFSPSQRSELYFQIQFFVFELEKMVVKKAEYVSLKERVEDRFWGHAHFENYFPQLDENPFLLDNSK